jgi:two-component system, NarL family, sensor kinase
MTELPAARRGDARADHARTLTALHERVKELDCLYAITRLSQRQDLALPELLAGVVGIVARAWQYPEITRVRVTVDGRRAASSGTRRPVARQVSPIVAQGKRVGRIEVGYLEPRPDCDEGPFLAEERHLLDAVADHLGRIVAARAAADRLRSLSRELLRAQETERQRLARELHDNVAQDLSGLRLGLGALADRLEGGGETALSEAAGRARELGAGLGRAVASLREVAHDLLPPDLAQLGLAETAVRLCEDYAARHDIPVDCFCDGMEADCRDFETRINVYRMLQEALSNACRHARAHRITVRLVASYPNCILRVSDDGQGFDPRQRLPEALADRRMGLWSLGERARLLGGSLRILSRPGRGTTIVAEVPWGEDWR